MPTWGPSSTGQTHGDDNAIIIVRFATDEGEVVGMAEESWAKKGGMDDTAEVYGSEGSPTRTCCRELDPHLLREPATPTRWRKRA